jgi:hypothetical protein
LLLNSHKTAVFENPRDNPTAMSVVLDELSTQISASSLDTPKQPWVSSPYSLISWWDMEQFSAEQFYTIAIQLSTLVHYAEDDLRKGARVPIQDPQDKIFLELLTGIEKDCQKLNLKVSVQTARWIICLLTIRLRYLAI